ncbi:MAG: SIMPL domain-containing protein [Acidimicrobiia bacterium]
MRRILLVGTALLLGACTTQSPDGQPIINVNTSETPVGVSVSGSGEVTGVPDTLSVDLGVSVLGATVSEATSSAATRAEAMISALVSGGVDRADITTANYTVGPEYDWSNDQQRLLGYRVANTIRAKIRDIADAGSILDSAVAAGGDAAQIHNLSFSIEDDAELVEMARDAAWDEAFNKAEQLAGLSGQTLGKAVSITESVSSPPIFYPAARAEAADGSTPIEPGTSSITITIQVQFSLEG